MNAVSGLPPSPKKVKIDILVVRVDKTGKLKNSKPCFKCIEYMLKYLPTKNYVLKNVYYSEQEGIIKKSLQQLVNSEKHVSKRHRGIYNKK